MKIAMGANDHSLALVALPEASARSSDPPSGRAATWGPRAAGRERFYRPTGMTFNRAEASRAAIFRIFVRVAYGPFRAAIEG